MTEHEVTGDHRRFQILFLLPLGKKIQFDLLRKFFNFGVCGSSTVPPTSFTWSFSIGFTFGGVFYVATKENMTRVCTMAPFCVGTSGAPFFPWRIPLLSDFCYFLVVLR